jgi:hypothetical protein
VLANDVRKWHCRTKAFVSIIASGSLGFNAASRAMLGYPKAGA